MLRRVMLTKLSTQSRTGRRPSHLSLLLSSFVAALAFVLISSSAQAISVDLAVNGGSVEEGGITISSQKTSSFDIVHFPSGESSGCSGGLTDCLVASGSTLVAQQGSGNVIQSAPATSISPMRAEWTKTTTITFEGGAVALNTLSFEKLYDGTTALITTADGSTITVAGSEIHSLGGDGSIDADLGGIAVSQISITSESFMFQPEVKSIDFNLSGSTPGDGYSNPVPEPTAGLLFFVGMGVVATATRRKTRSD